MGKNCREWSGLVKKSARLSADATNGTRISSAPPSDAEVVAALRRAGVPILILHGENDLIIPAYNSRRLLKQLGGGAVGASGVPVPGDAPVRLLELPACGHCPQEEMAEVVSAAIGDFAAEIGLLDP